MSTDSRGRTDYQSSGRGGAGNIRTSRSRDVHYSGPDDFSDTRGRELSGASKSPTRALSSSGRGGAGNIRSPSKDAATIRAEISNDRNIVDSHREHEGPHSSGRGGYGNIEKSRSRSRSQQRPPRASLDASGRGGYGNIHESRGPDLSRLDEDERREHHRDSGSHSTGRGGLANISGGAAPGTEHHSHHPHGAYATGRGGAGNIRGEMVEQRSE